MCCCWNELIQVQSSCPPHPNTKHSIVAGHVIIHCRVLMIFFIDKLRSQLSLLTAKHHRYLTQERWWKKFLFFFIFTEQFKESCKIPFKGGFSPMPCLSLSHFCCLIELMFEVVIITVLKKPRLKMVSSSETASFREINVLIFMCVIRIFFSPSILLLPLWLAGKRKTVNKI